MTDTNEEEVVAGLLPFTVNGEKHNVPELKRTPNREWKARMQATFAKLIGIPSDTVDGQQAMSDAECELVLAYDATHALGDLEDATEREIDTIYNRLVEVAFPLAQSQTALMVGIIRAAAESALASSTSGPSPTGTTAAPTILTDHLPSGKSSSSTRRRRTA
jgi:Tfp pilus assembly protein FimV